MKFTKTEIFYDWSYQDMATTAQEGIFCIISWGQWTVHLTPLITSLFALLTGHHSTTPPMSFLPSPPPYSLPPPPSPPRHWGRSGRDVANPRSHHQANEYSQLVLYHNQGSNYKISDTGCGTRLLRGVCHSWGRRRRRRRRRNKTGVDGRIMESKVWMHRVPKSIDLEAIAQPWLEPLTPRSDTVLEQCWKITETNDKWQLEPRREWGWWWGGCSSLAATWRKRRRQQRTR